jgi:hypothetical protein
MDIDTDIRARTRSTRSTRCAAIRRILVGLLVVALGLVASSDAVAATDPGTTRKRIPDAGISVAYPRSWWVVPHSEKALDAMVRKVGKKNPRMVRRLNEQARSIMAQAGRFAVVDVSSSSMGSLLVFSVDLPFPEPDDLRGAASAIEEQGFTGLGISSTMVGDRRALRLDMAGELIDLDGRAQSLRSTQLYVPNGSRTTIVQVTSTDDDGRAALRIEDLLQGIRPLDEA